MVYQPMVELLAYLRANGFKTFIASGGGVEFMRGWTERVYGIQPEQVIGSAGKMKFEMREGTPILIKLPEIELFDDKEGKPIAIQSRSAAVRSPRSATPTGTCRCCSGPWPAAVRDLPSSSITTTPPLSLRYDRTDKLQQFEGGGTRRSRRAGRL